MHRPHRPGLGVLRGPFGDPSGGVLAVDVYETEKAVVVRLDLPGVAREHLKVSVSDDRLVVRGERIPPAQGEPARPHVLEIAYGPFERRIAIPVPFEAGRVAATLEDGVLRVELPRTEPRRIDVEEG